MGTFDKLIVVMISLMFSVVAATWAYASAVKEFERILAEKTPQQVTPPPEQLTLGCVNGIRTIIVGENMYFLPLHSRGMNYIPCKDQEVNPQ